MANTKQQSRRMVRPTEAASGDFNGETFVLNPNHIFEADHELVRAYPHLFTDVAPMRPDVEQMTAAPGELRGA